jgi:hypothetical protein
MSETIDFLDLANKLFCTFSKKDSLNETLDTITSTYSVLYNKVFVLSSTETDEYVCTYNIDTGNVNDSSLLQNTILTHRRKETNTLYTINALNSLISTLNNGVVDHSYRVHWSDYSNCILLTRNGEFTRLNTKIYQIVNLN